MRLLFLRPQRARAPASRTDTLHREIAVPPPYVVPFASGRCSSRRMRWFRRGRHSTRNLCRMGALRCFDYSRAYGG